VQLAEQAFSDELSKLVEHLVERLTGQTDGKPKVFRDSAVENLTEFFDRFKQLNIRSNDDLDTLVERAQQIVHGRDPQELRDNQVLRTSVASELAEVQNVLDVPRRESPSRSKTSLQVTRDSPPRRTAVRAAGLPPPLVRRNDG
jgi:hypothetical protein